MKRVKDFMGDGFTLGQPHHFSALGVAPIISDSMVEIPPIDLLQEALDKKTILITEVNESGSVPVVKVENKSTDRSCLLLEGMVISGGKQTRNLLASVIVLAGATIQIPVACVERNRWSYSRRDFQSTSSIFRAKSRAVQKTGVTASLRLHGTYHADQGAVWRETQDSLNLAGAYSPTSNYSDAHEKMTARIQGFVQSIQPVADQVGAIFFSHEGVIGAEVMATPELFSRSHDQIVGSFAWEALSAPPLNGVSIDPVKAWWGNVLDSPFTLHKSVGVGDDVRIETDHIIGSGLVYGGITMHLSCFPAIDPLFQRQPTRLNRSSIRERQRNLRSTIGD